MFFIIARLLMLLGLISFYAGAAACACQDAINPAPTKAVGAVQGAGNCLVILLLNRPLVLSDARIQQAVQASLGADAVVREKSPTGKSTSPVRKNTEFLVQSGAKRYAIRGGNFAFLSQDQLAEVEELRIRKLLEVHTAWISAEQNSPQPQETTSAGETLAYQHLCRILAACLREEKDAGGLVLGVLVPGRSIVLASPGNVTALLQEQNPIAALETAVQTPVLDVASNAAEMKAATKKAKEEWPTFVKAFRKRNPTAGNSFNVLMPFREGEKTEIMWIEVTGIEGDTVRGTLANQPALLTNLKQGDSVNGMIRNLSDWIYTDPATEQPVGGFLVQLLSREPVDATPDAKPE